MVKRTYSPYYNRYQLAPYLFGAQHKYPHPADLNKYNTLQPKIHVKVEKNFIIFPAFCLHAYGLKYINPAELRVNLDHLYPGKYKIIIVHNFQAEDCNPNIDECLAAIFFARYINGIYEIPEDYPIECRSVKTLGVIDTHNKYFYDKQ